MGGEVRRGYDELRLRISYSLHDSLTPRVNRDGVMCTDSIEMDAVWRVRVPGAVFDHSAVTVLAHCS
jgi:hypothetical protein